ncbi:MAG: cation:proton antiporter [Ignisphaera sp.]|nr:cation:proton antiporter [Ignisphaera sp.]
MVPESLALNLLGPLTPTLIILVFLTPLFAKVFRSDRKVPFVLALLGVLYSVVASTIVFLYVYQSGKPLVYLYGGWPPHFGIVYEVDAFNALLAMLTSWVMLPIVLYSYWYSQHFDEATWYYTLLLGLLTGLLGVIYTGDAFNLFVMLEVLSISAYSLVAYHRERAEAVEAAAKYALIGLVATTMYFFALILIYAGIGSVNMALLAMLSRFSQALNDPGVKYLTLLALALSLWTFTYKSALFPNHFWLPDAHPEAPTPVSAALSGLVVNVGIYATARFLYTLFGSDSMLSGYREAVLIVILMLGIIGGVVGAMMMLLQRDIKRLLAYSTISHVGIAYIGLAAGFLVGYEEAIKIAVAGAITHIVAHSIAKALLFMSSGVFIDAAGSRDLDDLQGVGRLYPLTSISMIIGFLSLAGFIPLIGFYSKLLIAYGYFIAGLAIIPVLIIIISAISLLGYMKAITAIVFGVPRKSVERKAGVGWVEVILFLMALSLIILGILFYYITPVFDGASLDLVKNVNTYINEALRYIPGGLSKWLP